MKQGKTEKAVFAKLSKVEKVELSSVSEVSKLTNSVEQQSKEFSKLATKAEGLAVEFDKAARRYHTLYMEVNDLEQKMDNYNKSQDTIFLDLDYAIDQLEDKLKGLGVENPKELSAAKAILKNHYSDYEKNADAYFRLKELQSQYKFPF